MLDLPHIIETHVHELGQQLGQLPDAVTLVNRLHSILSNQPPPPWFPMVSLEQFLQAMATLEESILSRMGWEVEPDPVVRANARARLRAAIARLVREYSARCDRELTTLRSREQSLNQQLERSRVLLRAFHQASPVGMAVLDASGRVLSWNPEATHLTRVDAGSQINRSILPLLPGLDAHFASVLPAEPPVLGGAGNGSHMPSPTPSVNPFSTPSGTFHLGDTGAHFQSVSGQAILHGVNAQPQAVLWTLLGLPRAPGMLSPHAEAMVLTFWPPASTGQTASQV